MEGVAVGGLELEVGAVRGLEAVASVGLVPLLLCRPAIPSAALPLVWPSLLPSLPSLPVLPILPLVVLLFVPVPALLVLVLALLVLLLELVSLLPPRLGLGGFNLLPLPAGGAWALTGAADAGRGEALAAGAVLGVAGIAGGSRRRWDSSSWKDAVSSGLTVGMHDAMSLPVGAREQSKRQMAWLLR